MYEIVNWAAAAGSECTLPFVDAERFKRARARAKRHRRRYDHSGTRTSSDVPMSRRYYYVVLSSSSSSVPGYTGHRRRTRVSS